MITEFDPVSATAGGLLLGLSATLVLWLNGKIAGISGIVARIFNAVPGDTGWRATFLVGMIAGGALSFAFIPGAAEFHSLASWPTLVAAGFLVGLGTRLGGGCTSGHGVCGLSRGSLSSLAAVVTFMVAGAVTVYVVRHVIGGAA